MCEHALWNQKRMLMWPLLQPQHELVAPAVMYTATSQRGDSTQGLEHPSQQTGQDKDEAAPACEPMCPGVTTDEQSVRVTRVLSVTCRWDGGGGGAGGGWGGRGLLLRGRSH